MMKRRKLLGEIMGEIGGEEGEGVGQGLGAPRLFGGFTHVGEGVDLPEKAAQDLIGPALKLRLGEFLF